MASQYAVASALILQLIRIHPSLMTSNTAFIALKQFLYSRRSISVIESDVSSAKLGPLASICNNVVYLQSQLGSKIEKALKAMEKLL
jgi:hypothetical protein